MGLEDFIHCYNALIELINEEENSKNQAKLPPTNLFKIITQYYLVFST
jgi:hypothetical protein